MAGSIEAAAEARRKIVRMVVTGQPGDRVNLRLPEAALTFTLPSGVFETLQEKNRELGIAVHHDRVAVTVGGSDYGRVAAYNALYGILQSLEATNGAASIVEEMDYMPEQFTDFPYVAQVVGWAQTGQVLDGPDLAAAQIHLYGLWTAIRDKDSVCPPGLVFSAVTGGL